MLDDDRLRSFGFLQPLPLTRPALRAMLRLRGQFTRGLPPRMEPHSFTDEHSRSHPGGYEINATSPRNNRGFGAAG